MIKQKTFDILVLTSDEDGGQHQKTVNGVKAGSAKELISLYAATGENIRILREYGDDNSDTPDQPAPAQIQQPQNIIQPKPVIQQQKSQPQYFTVGGIECKIDNGKVYQKQWLTVNADDMKYYRLISDSTNKIIPMTGKHLEQKKWVLVEDNKEDNE